MEYILPDDSWIAIIQAFALAGIFMIAAVIVGVYSKYQEIKKEVKLKEKKE